MRYRITRNTQPPQKKVYFCFQIINGCYQSQILTQLIVQWNDFELSWASHRTTKDLWLNFRKTKVNDCHFLPEKLISVVFNSTSLSLFQIISSLRLQFDVFSWVYYVQSNFFRINVLKKSGFPFDRRQQVKKISMHASKKLIDLYLVPVCTPHHKIEWNFPRNISMFYFRELNSDSFFNFVCLATHYSEHYW